MLKIDQLTGAIARALSPVPQLLIRLILAYGFYKPAMAKLDSIENIAAWFSELGIPLPTLNAYLATFTEVSGFILLALGLGVRYITIPLMVTMLVAIGFVHAPNGFEASDNGFEIPFYYLVMLLTLFVHGAGSVSLDHLLRRYREVKRKMPAGIR